MAAGASVRARLPARAPPLPAGLPRGPLQRPSSLLRLLAVATMDKVILGSGPLEVLVLTPCPAVLGRSPPLPSKRFPQAAARSQLCWRRVTEPGRGGSVPVAARRRPRALFARGRTRRMPAGLCAVRVSDKAMLPHSIGNNTFPLNPEANIPPSARARARARWFPHRLQLLEPPFPTTGTTRWKEKKTRTSRHQCSLWTSTLLRTSRLSGSSCEKGKPWSRWPQNSPPCISSPPSWSGDCLDC
mmetsp:Transcript_14661/g.32354  ORF Transcript_14661/g.32354 Transcript_14661/m.32354 type:complete len:243 (-) Transcript_14661:384-1112(-)